MGFGDNSISQALQPFLTDDELPQVGTREDLNDFGDKVGIRAGMLTRVNGYVSCFCNKHLQK